LAPVRAGGEELAAIAGRRGLPRMPETCRAGSCAHGRDGLQAGWDGECFLRAYDISETRWGLRSAPRENLHRDLRASVAGGHRAKDGNWRDRRSIPCGYLATPPASSSSSRRIHATTESGEISSYPPGYKEQRRKFSVTTILGDDCRSHGGNGDGRSRLLFAHQPVGARAAERFASLRTLRLCADDPGRDAPTYGKPRILLTARRPGITSITQWILGVRPEYDDCASHR